jgi:hypothetical protein
MASVLAEMESPSITKQEPSFGASFFWKINPKKSAVKTEVWKDGLSSENEALVKELLIGLKDTTCVDVLIAAYRDNSFQQIKRDLTAVFWNSKLDFSTFLSDFVLFAIEGDFLDAFEAITLIEQFENTCPEHAVMESQLLLKEYFGSDENRDAQKDQLLSDIALILKEYDEESGTEDLFFE